MCEANVYVLKSGREELLMEKVDRIVPGEDDLLVMDNIFGERRIVKARIKEMELVHHRIVVEPVEEHAAEKALEIWLEPATDHGHFHPGEMVRLFLHKGYNMQPVKEAEFGRLEVKALRHGREELLETRDVNGVLEISLDPADEGLMTMWVREEGERQLYAKIIVEIGHHHHHGLEPVGLPLEIVPSQYSHVHLGDNYEIQVLKEGRPLAGAEVMATYSGSRNREYPYRMTTDAGGKARVFLTARGNWLFSVTDGSVTSTFTLVKSF